MDAQKEMLEALLDQTFVIGFGNGKQKRTLQDEYMYMVQLVSVRREFEPTEWWQGDLASIVAEYRIQGEKA